MTGRHRWTLPAIAAAALLAGGCAPWASYPPLETASEMASPELEPFPTLMAEAIWYGNLEYGTGEDDFRWNLPPGTRVGVHDRVAKRIGAGRPLETPGAPAIHVESVRARGTEGEVDLIVPGDGGTWQLVTVRLRHAMLGRWTVRDARVWRIPKDPPPPSYPAAVAAAAAAAS